MEGSRMELLQIEPPIPFGIADSSLSIVVVGCGGTGSHLVQILARLMFDLREKNQRPLQLTLVDGDRVERKNVGRQLFSTHEIGKNKAQALAARFNALFGLAITAVPEMATQRLLQQLAPARQEVGILVGAVDNVAARTSLAVALASQSWRIWIDAGNHFNEGQVSLGTTTSVEGLRGSLKLGTICTALPAPTIMCPDLLQEDPEDVVDDCATAIADDRQSLLVNSHMSHIVGGYLHQLVTKRHVNSFYTEVNVAAMSMRSIPITQTNVSRVTGLSASELQGMNTP